MNTLKTLLVAGLLLGASHSFANGSNCAARNSQPKNTAEYQQRAKDLAGKDRKTAPSNRRYKFRSQKSTKG
ncbi:MAG: hypothetical protein H6625_04910 [Bdellovibrionaceae bacterium]|nr:hypothetical protein [Pseudobdellovibrionaceae bacterium]